MMMPNPMNLSKINIAQVRLLERLCNACAVSGDENEVRSIVIEQVRPHADEVRVDALGNVLVKYSGRGKNRFKVMLSAHMDEVGMMLTHEEDKDEGIFRFDVVGGINERQLAGKMVWIGRKHVPGVIGAKPIHFSTPDERKSPLSLDTMRIDVGPGNNSKVKIGDRATFASHFSRTGPSLRAKALDNRLGVATLIEIIKHPPDNLDLFAAFTVQEEVGLRGARVAAYALNPDISLNLDCTLANDLPVLDRKDVSSEENTHYNTRLGAGPAIYLMDAGTIYDPRLIQFFIQTAEKYAIPFQLRQPGGGSTDSGSIHKQRSGIPALSISVPARYLHTSAAIARVKDWENYLNLIYTGLSGLSPTVISKPR
jgi:putative aminopeptidase FrvX